MSYARNRLRKDKRHTRLFGLCAKCAKPFSSERQVFVARNGRRLHWNDCIIREIFLGNEDNPFTTMDGEEYIRALYRILNESARTGHTPEDYQREMVLDPLDLTFRYRRIIGLDHNQGRHLF